MLVSRLRALIPAQLFATLVCGLALFGSGCVHKPVQTTAPVLVPSIEAEPQPATAPAPEPSQPISSKPAAAETVPQQSTQKPKPRPHKPPRRPAPPVQAESPKPEQAKTPTPDNSVQITADVPRAAVQSQRQNTEQLLRNSSAKLNHLTRRLSDGEQGMARQARNYIAQSNQALESGDIERAYNLAVKASLLTNELVK